MRHARARDIVACARPSVRLARVPPARPTRANSYCFLARTARDWCSQRAWVPRWCTVKRPSYCGPKDTRVMWCAACARKHPGAVPTRVRLFGLNFARVPTPATETRGPSRNVGNAGVKRRHHCEHRWCATCGAKKEGSREKLVGLNLTRLISQTEAGEAKYRGGSSDLANTSEPSPG